MKIKTYLLNIYYKSEFLDLPTISYFMTKKIYFIYFVENFDERYHDVRNCRVSQKLIFLQNKYLLIFSGSEMITKKTAENLTH